MIIEIDDNLPGETIKREIIVQQAVYAMSKFKRKSKAAEFLGVSDRTFRDWCHKYDELTEYIYFDRKHRHKSEEDRLAYFDMLRRYPTTN